MTPSPTLPERSAASAHAILLRTERAALAAFTAQQDRMERPFATAWAREQAFKTLCSLEQAAIDATRARRAFESRHPSVREVA